MQREHTRTEYYPVALSHSCPFDSRNSGNTLEAYRDRAGFFIEDPPATKSVMDLWVRYRAVVPIAATARPVLCRASDGP